MYYLQSRYYDPEVGRFINADIYVATGQGILGNNMCAYCRNNPVCRVDISGTADQDRFGNSDGELLSNDEIENRSGGGGPNSATSSGVQKLTFSSNDKLVQHYEQHNPEFGNAFSSPQEYLDAANYVIQNGEYIESSNAYVRFYGYQGHANYAFVGLSRDGSYITTFHLKHATRIYY